MALTFTAGTPYESTGGVTSAVVTLPTGLTDGDHVLLAVAYIASAGTISAPAGYSTVLASTDTTLGSTSGHHAIFYKLWTSGDTDPTVTVSATGRLAALPVKVSGADTTTFIDTAAVVQQATSGQTNVISPTITPTGTVLVGSYMARSSTNGVTFTWTPPAGMTQVGAASSTSTSATNGSVMLATQAVTAGTATGTRTAVASSNVTGGMGVSFAIKEAATGPAQGAAAGSWSFTGTATGSTDRAGTASGSWAFTGAASGQTSRAGAATGSWSFTGAASGTAPAVAASTGTATGAWSFTGAATGSTIRSGTASGSWAFTGTATGAPPSTTPPTHTYGYATLTPSVGTAVLTGNGTSTATIIGTVGGFGLDFGLSFGAFTVMGPVTATITPTAPGTAELQLD